MEIETYMTKLGRCGHGTPGRLIMPLGVGAIWCIAALGMSSSAGAQTFACNALSLASGSLVWRLAGRVSAFTPFAWP